MKLRILFLSLFMSIGLAACQSVSNESATLYNKLGGNAGVTAIVHGTLQYTLKDERIAHTFENSNVDRVEKLIIEQICDLSGGPCKYSGMTMKTSHTGLGLTSMHFNALVENMQKAMSDENVPYRVQNQLLALLAPMHRDVIER